MTRVPSYDAPLFPPGWVWLAGAGPGDPGLLTLAVWDALRQADVIVYDALVGEQILAMAPPTARLEHAGKRGGKPSPLQRDISLRLVELARQGLRVLRLKGGDPYVFGRGGEEALTLLDHGVPFRVLPGVTVGVAGLAAAGIPATHRDFNQTVSFVTGHGADGEAPQIDWEALARGGGMLVIYMAIKHLGDIAARLIAGGRPGDEPVAVIRNATLADQAVLETQLDRCAADVAAAGFEPPAIVAVGRGVALRGRLLAGG